MANKSGRQQRPKMSASGAVIGTFPVGKAPDVGAVDLRGHVWITNSGASSVTVLDSTGRHIGTYSTGSGSPWNVVIDAEGNAWTDNWTSSTVSKFGPNGDLLGVYRVRKNPQVLAIDSAGNVWVPNQGDDTGNKVGEGRQSDFHRAGACSRPRRFSHRWRWECVGIRHRFA